MKTLLQGRKPFHVGLCCRSLTFGPPLPKAIAAGTTVSVEPTQPPLLLQKRQLALRSRFLDF